MTSYNLIKTSIENGLNALAIGTGGGYIQLLKAPTNANVRIHLNDSFNDGIPLKAYHSIKALGINKIFVSCDSVSGGEIEILQTPNAENLQLITPASDVNVDTINSLLNLDTNVINVLDKIANPYNAPTETIINNISADEVQIFSKLLTCDKVELFLMPCKYSVASKANYSSCLLDNIEVLNSHIIRLSNDSISTTGLQKIILTDVKNKTIICNSRSDTYTSIFIIKEYTLKN